MKQFCFFLLAILMIANYSYSQENKTSSTKKSQVSLQNEIFVGYGALGIYYFTGRMKHSDSYPTEDKYNNTSFPNQPVSPGNFFIGYNRSLNKVISMGIMFGYQQFTYSGTGYEKTSPYSLVNINESDQLITGIARITFTYLNKPAVRLYSGIGIGFTIDFGTATCNGMQFTERKLWPGGQLTLMGIRFGRSFGGFLEFGFLSYGMVNAGLSYKIGD
jgi:hypothetical protein